MDIKIVDALWAQAEPLIYVTREQFDRAIAGWKATAYHRDGELAFVTLVKGPEFHFSSFETGAKIDRALIREWLQPVIDACGFVTTRTPIEGADRQHRINRTIGFVPMGHDEFFTHYRMEALRCP